MDSRLLDGFEAARSEFGNIRPLCGLASPASMARTVRLVKNFGTTGKEK
jgi:hypothetical protein